MASVNPFGSKQSKLGQTIFGGGQPGQGWAGWQSLPLASSTPAPASNPGDWTGTWGNIAAPGQQSEQSQAYQGQQSGGTDFWTAVSELSKSSAPSSDWNLSTGQTEGKTSHVGQQGPQQAPQQAPVYATPPPAKGTAIGTQMPSGGNTGTNPSQQLPGYVQEPTGTLGEPIQNSANPTPQPLPGTFVSDAWRKMDDATRAYYEDHPQDAFRQYIADFFGADTFKAAWGNSLFSEIYAEFLRAAEGNPEMHFVDFLTHRFISTLNNRFANLPSSRRGERQAARGPRITW